MIEWLFLILLILLKQLTKENACFDIFLAIHTFYTRKYDLKIYEGGNALYNIIIGNNTTNYKTTSFKGHNVSALKKHLTITYHFYLRSLL